ncbi:methyltransferase domain-containing protein [Jiella sp. MQZ9-1]|uniref:Class I SAM-dependent methyltransferase n=1 Tax=Jiella flava TaxID=2816857 RepID=A0A939FTT5_9HYPH|nr:class I SAM-dependent methyltransferase [Jiella flava]MBO0661823.1 class I SAM-dependent methyltransferase [Jiella flava]MCD2470463.1 methyltransferase domain-containing protein [Jiella flava]
MRSVETNYSIRDEIRDYWSMRAASFDESVGHEIFSEAERRGWHRLLRKHLGAGQGRAALDLACGTAVISHLLDDLGFQVTGADWSEDMLARARRKAEARGADIRFVMRDAENTMEPRESYDVITNRHLVWTLVDPSAAFAEWFALLKPGGKLLIVDTNQDATCLGTRIRKAWEKLTGQPNGAGVVTDLAAAERHRRIREQVYFSAMMPAEAVVALLQKAGFVDPVVDRSMGDIHWAQARKMTLLQGFERLTQDRYAICVTKPTG